MNRKQRRAHARHAKSHKSQSGHAKSRWPHDGAPPLRHRQLEPVLSASADADDHAKFRAMLQPTLEAAHPAAFLARASTFITVATDHEFGLANCAQLIKRVDDDDSLIGHALLTALSVLAATSDDRAHAQSLLEARSDKPPAGMPPWLSGLAQARAVTAFEHSDLWWDFSFQAIELDIVGHAFTVFLNVDHVLGYSVHAAHFASESIADFFEEFPHTLIEPGTSSQYLSLSDAGRRFAYALDGSDKHPYNLHGDAEWRRTEALVNWAGRLASSASLSLPIDHSTPDSVTAHFDPDDAQPSIDSVKSDFMGSSHGKRAQDEGVHAGLDELVAYAAGEGHRRPLAWGPVRVADFLLRHVPENVWSDLDELRDMVTLLRHWIAYINERCDMPAGMASESVERIDECEAVYLAIVESRAQSLADFTTDLVSDRR